MCGNNYMKSISKMNFSTWELLHQFDEEISGITGFTKYEWERGRNLFFKELTKHHLDLFLTTKNVVSTLASESERIKTVIGDSDPGTSGDAAEKSWERMLKSLLPQYKIITKGIISGDNKQLSPQIDIVIIDGNYPDFKSDIKVYPHTSVIAAFESKLSLRTGDIKKAINTANIIKQFGESNRDKARESPILYGILALSNGIDNIAKQTFESIYDQIVNWSKNISPLCMLDFVVVLGELCFLHNKKIFCFDIEDKNCEIQFISDYKILIDKLSPANCSLGFFLYSLLSIMALENKNLIRTKENYSVFDSKKKLIELPISACALNKLFKMKFVDEIRDRKITEEEMLFKLFV